MFFRLLKYAIKNILRNKFLSISSVLVLTLLMFFINILVVLHNISFKLIDSINSKLTISLYLKDDYSQNSHDIKSLLSEIQTFSNWINIDYKTKFQVLEDLKERDPDLVRIIEWDNPLPDTINLSNIKIIEYEWLNEIIEKRSFLLSSTSEWSDYISSYKSQYERIMKVIVILKTLQIWLYFMISLFLLAISIIVYSIIWNFVYHYKDEIYITKLVWWSNSFIHWPFTIQWILYSSFAFVFSISLFILLLVNISVIFPESWYSFAIDEWYIMIFLSEFVIFWILWWFSWYLSSKKYLN